MSLATMPLAPQETRTFFVSFTTWDRRSILQSNSLCELLLDVLRDNRSKQRMEIHEFVFMPDHVHLIVTPAPLVSLEKAMQFIKGGFSFRAKRELNFNRNVWQKGYNEHRIKEALEYEQHVEYVWMNPVKAGIVTRAEDFVSSSAHLTSSVDPAPAQFRPLSRGAVGTGRAAKAAREQVASIFRRTEVRLPPT